MYQAKVIYIINVIWIQTTLVYLIAEQDVLSEQALNSKIHPARFLLSAY